MLSSSNLGTHFFGGKENTQELEEDAPHLEDGKKLFFTLPKWEILYIKRKLFLIVLSWTATHSRFVFSNKSSRTIKTNRATTNLQVGPSELKRFHGDRRRLKC